MSGSNLVTLVRQGNFLNQRHITKIYFLKSLQLSVLRFWGILRRGLRPLPGPRLPEAQGEQPGSSDEHQLRGARHWQRLHQRNTSISIRRLHQVTV